MANIYIIDGIRLNKPGLQVKDENGSWINLHCQQGMLDGACVVYSTIMALLYMGVLCEADIQIMTKLPDRRTKKGKFLNHLFEQQGMIREGYYLDIMADEIQKIIPDYVVNYYRGEDAIFKAKECIENGLPAIISVVNDNKNIHHTILAIGTEYKGEKDKEKLLKLFCLDPAYIASKTTYWNCIIDTGRTYSSNHPYWYITDKDSCKVNILEIITFDY